MGIVIAALVAVAGALGLFHGLISVTLLTCIRANPNMALISPAMDLLIILACLSAAWILGFFQKEVVAFRHIGTRFYGHEPTEQGYITTKWLVAIFPLLPIRSYLIARRISEIFHPEFEYQKNAMQPVEGYFHWMQMLRTASISYGTIVWCLACLWLMFFSTCI